MISAQSFISLRHRNFRLIWIGLFVSFTGSMMQNAALLWHVSLLVRPERKALALGLVGLVKVAPIIGASKLAHLDEAVAALEVRLEPEDVASLEEPYQPHTIQGHS